MYTSVTVNPESGVEPVLPAPPSLENAKELDRKGIGRARAVANPAPP